MMRRPAEPLACTCDLFHTAARSTIRSISATAHLPGGISRKSLVVSPKLPSRKSKCRKVVGGEVYETCIRANRTMPPHHVGGVFGLGDRQLQAPNHIPWRFVPVDKFEF